MSPKATGRTDPRFARALLASDEAFSREDERDDSAFYRKARMVPHLDATALAMVEALIGSLVTDQGPAILDLMASWDSHIPPSVNPSRLVGLGMNVKELRENRALTRRVMQDLNKNPVLPFEDQSYDVVLNVVSVEYLTNPFRVFKEVGRILKPGGLLLVIFSNRWFPTKVVRAWADAREEERIGIVEEYVRSAGVFQDPEVFLSMGLPRPETDRYHKLGVPSDPVFAVMAEKEGGDPNRPPRRLPDDPSVMEIDAEAVEVRKREVADTLACPYCQTKLSRWEVPDDPCIDWPEEYLYLCFNDACPFVVRGWRFMWEQGTPGHSYRYLFNPRTGASVTVPIRGLDDLKAGVREPA